MEIEVSRMKTFLEEERMEGGEESVLLSAKERIGKA